MKLGFLLVTLAALTIATVMIVGGILMVFTTPTPQKPATIETVNQTVKIVADSLDTVQLDTIRVHYVNN